MLLSSANSQALFLDVFLVLSFPDGLKEVYINVTKAYESLSRSMLPIM